MKNKKIFMLALVLILPCLILFGCDEVATYKITVSANCSNGIVYGAGTYQEGETVTLTANGISNGSTKSKFVAWVYQNKTILENNDVYTISTSEDNYSSTLTFTATSATTDKYTAIFQDNKQMYYTLDSYKFAKNIHAPEPLPEDATTLFNGILSVSFGENNTTYREVFNAETEFKENLTVKADGVKDVMVLTKLNPYYLRFSIDNGNGNVNIKTIPILYNENSVAGDVNATFNQDKTVSVTYTFELANEESSGDDEEESPTTYITLCLTLKPLDVE